MQFTNTNAIGKVALYTPLGDQFVRFYVLDVNGTPAGQKLRLQPGVYEAHFRKNANTPGQQETVQKFIVNSNNTVEVELK